jgi:hypothetical protein
MPKKARERHSKEEAREELKDVVGCLSCGLPMAKTSRESASEIAEICPRCAGSDGHLKSYAEVFERLVTQHYMKELGMSRPKAEQSARAKLAELPFWKDLRHEDL